MSSKRKCGSHEILRLYFWILTIKKERSQKKKKKKKKKKSVVYETVDT